MARPVTIVGGGLAGLTLGIALRQRDVPVTICEVGNYPRHRVCGEFISGRGQQSLARLGLLPKLQDRPETCCLANDVAFFAGQSSVPSRPLPEPALSISRWALDDFLAREFVSAGGDLQMGRRWREDFGEGVVRANGRRVEPVAEGWRFFGLKIHARNVSLVADLELHFLRAGYVGVSRLPGGEVNICGLFRSSTTVPDLASRWSEWLAGPGDSRLHNHFATAKLDDSSLCTIAGFSLRARHATQTRDCSIGDALTMIPPLTGNGMSMAFESAELACGPLTRFSRSEQSWEAARREIAQTCDTAFARRLRWAGWLQRLLLNPAGRSVLLFLTGRSERVWRMLFSRTR